jgi:hypothetical protein
MRVERTRMRSEVMAMKKMARVWMKRWASAGT